MTARQRSTCFRAGDHPERALVVIGLPRVAAILDRIAADIDEPARAQPVQDLDTAAVPPDPGDEHRRPLSPDELSSQPHCEDPYRDAMTPSSLTQNRSPPGLNMARRGFAAVVEVMVLTPASRCTCHVPAICVHARPECVPS
jgi:hypothetical protein